MFRYIVRLKDRLYHEWSEGISLSVVSYTFSFSNSGGFQSLTGFSLAIKIHEHTASSTEDNHLRS